MFSRPKRPSHAIDMAPLIDVVFLLLIFFMLTSSFTQPSLPLELPKATGETTPPDDTLVVSVDAAGAVSISGEPVALDRFEEALAGRLSASPGQAVNFRGDRAVEYGVFIDLMDRARRAGAGRFNLIHDPRPAE